MRGGFSHIFAVLCGFSMFFHLEISEDEDEILISFNFKFFYALELVYYARVPFEISVDHIFIFVIPLKW